MITLDELARKLQAGEDLATIAAATIPPGMRRLLERCARARRFDHAVVEEVLLDGIASSAASFEELIAHPAVERIPTRGEVFRVRPGEGAALIAVETSALDEEEREREARRLDAALAAHFASRGRSWEVERLYHLLPVDPADALRLFNELYEEADRSFDRGRCQDLLDAFESRREHMTPELAVRRNDRRTYLAARSFWSEEFYHTSSYFERAEARASLEALLGGRHSWILQVHGPGGSGKSMFVRWAIARRCVPEPDRIPVARIDFDFVDPFIGGDAPWELLARLAEQLNHQLNDAPLREVADKVREHGRTRPAGARGNTPGARDLEDEIVHRFSSALREARREEPVLIILDTIEDVLLRYSANLFQVIKFLNRVHQQYPGLKLLLVGRYDLLDPKWLPEFRSLFGEVCISCCFGRYTEDEARRFLIHTSRLTPGPYLDAVVARPDGRLPFKLILLADVIGREPTLSPEDVRTYPSVDLLYLVERILERIPDGEVQWVLRYGAVPRRLTLSFLLEVMSRYLPRAMAGVADFDEPTRGLPQRGQRSNIFPVDTSRALDAEVDYGGLWRRLTAYASSTSWVSLEGGGTPMLVLHEEVVHPMRRLLEDHPISRLLHSDAAAHFEAKAREWPDDWHIWASEAIYHRIQLDGAAAAGYWEEWIAEAMRNGGITAARLLAREIIGNEYVDENGAPRERKGGGFVVSHGMLLRAHLILAQVAIAHLQAQGGNPDDSVWNDAARFIDAAERLLRVAGGAPHRVEVMLLKADLACMQRRHDDALAFLDSVAELAEGALRVELVTRRAEILELTDSPDAGKALKLAVELTEAGGDVGRRLHLRLRLGDWLYRRARYDHALEVCRGSLAEAKKLPHESAVPLSLLSAAIQVERGDTAAAFDDANAAERWSRRVEEGAGEWSPPLEVTGARAVAYLAARDPIHALREVALGLSCFEDPAQSGDPFRRNGAGAQGHIAALYESRGQALAELMSFSEASVAFEKARTLWLELNREEDGHRCLRRCIELELRGTGNLRIASELLSRAENVRAPLSEEARTSLSLLAAELCVRTRVEPPPVPAPAGWRASRQAALHELTWGGPESRVGGIERLLAAVYHIRSESARLRALQPLRYCRVLDPSCEGFDPVRRALKATVASGMAAAQQFGARDRDQLLLTAVEAYRLIRDYREAVVLLRQAARGLSTHAAPFVTREILRAADQLKVVLPGYSERRMERFLDAHRDYPLLCGVFLLEAAERSDNVRLARRQADRSAELLEADYGFPNRWNARLNELQASLGKKAGSRQTEVEYHWDVARSNYELLGDRVSLGRVEKQAGRSSRLAFSDHSCVLRISDESAVSRNVKVSLVTPRRTDEWRKPEAWPSGRVFSYATLKEFVAFPCKAAVQLGKRWLISGVSAELEEVAAGANPLDFRVEIEPALHWISALPWEAMCDPRSPYEPLARSPALGCFYRSTPGRSRERDVTIWLQKALNLVAGTNLRVDGIPGPRTGNALVGFQRSVGGNVDGVLGPATRRQLFHALRASPPGSLRVLILQSSQQRQLRAQRGGEHEGVHLSSVYNRFGVMADVIEDPQPAVVEARLKAELPQILHICGSMRESLSAGAVDLDFVDTPPESLSSSDESRWSVTALGAVLQAAERPLVILDINRPPGRTELMDQLFLRNVFASDLFSLGSTLGVLATGLTSYGEREWQQSLIAGYLVRRCSLGEIAMILRKEALVLGAHPQEVELATMLAAASTVLYASDPALVPL